MLRGRDGGGIGPAMGRDRDVWRIRRGDNLE